MRIIQEQYAALAPAKTPFFSNLLDGLLTILMGLAGELLIMTVFLYRIAKGFAFQSVFGLSGDAIREVASSGYPMLICGLLLIAFLLTAVLKNLRSSVRLFRILAAALVITGFCGLLISVSTAGLSGGLFLSTAAFRSMSSLIGLGCLIAAAVLLSVSVCLEIGRRGNRS